jgi:hypothetical protein
VVLIFESFAVIAITRRQLAEFRRAFADGVAMYLMNAIVWIRYPPAFQVDPDAVLRRAVVGVAGDLGMESQET